MARNKSKYNRKPEQHKSHINEINDEYDLKQIQSQVSEYTKGTSKNRKNDLKVQNTRRGGTFEENQKPYKFKVDDAAEGISWEYYKQLDNKITQFHDCFENNILDLKKETSELKTSITNECNAIKDSVSSIYDKKITRYLTEWSIVVAIILAGFGYFIVSMLNENKDSIKGLNNDFNIIDSKIQESQYSIKSINDDILEIKTDFNEMNKQKRKR